MNHEEGQPDADTRVTMAMLGLKLDAVIAQQAAQQTAASGEARDMRQEIRDLRLAMDKVPSMIDEKLDRKMNVLVTKEAFEPVQKLVYGLVSVLLMALVGAMTALVLGARGVAP